MSADLQVRLGTLVLQNPVLVASGTFGYGLEFQHAVQLNQLGGLVTKTLTREARQGNPPPRLVETPAGMLNAVGLQNVGLVAFLREKLPALRQSKASVIVSILDETPQGLSAMAEELNQAEGVAAIELNLSCPNLKGRTHVDSEDSGTSQMVAQDAEATFQMVHAARERTTKPLIAKLSPDVTDPRPIAQAAERAGADALAMSNTFTGMSVDPQTKRSRLGSMTGGLSGPAIRPLALYRVWLVKQVVHCPIIGIGGILHLDDALEFFLAGASAVAVGTANFAQPHAAINLLNELRRHLARHQLASIHDVIGTLQPA